MHPVQVEKIHQQSRREQRGSHEGPQDQVRSHAAADSPLLAAHSRSSLPAQDPAPRAGFTDVSDAAAGGPDAHVAGKPRHPSCAATCHH